MIPINSKETVRFLKFATVGAIGAVIDFSIFNILILFRVVIPVVASVISFVFAVFSNFLGNRFWTYPDSRSKPVQKQISQFVIVSFIGLFIRTPLFAWLETILIRLGEQILPRHSISPEFFGHNVSLAVAIFVVMLWNFLANRVWTYNDIGS